MSVEHESALRRLASRAGILPEYVDQTGQQTRRTSDDTRRALLAAMRFDVASERAAEESLRALDAIERSELLAPVAVVRDGSPDTNELVTHGLDTGARWRMEITLESGETHTLDGRANGDRIRLPNLPLGYHRIRFTTTVEGTEHAAEQSRIVVPRRCLSPVEVLNGHTAFGLTANLYTVRSDTNWGVGDFTDLAELARWAGSRGAAFVGVNPLHALLNRGMDVSPYNPVSRLFRNPIYIDPSNVPELAHAAEVRSRLASPELEAELQALRETSSVRYEQVMAVKGLALDALHHVFQARRELSRDPAFDDFVARSDPALSMFATWMAIAERHGGDHRRWPEELRSPKSPAVRAFAEQARGRVDYHRWLQYEADRQLSDAARGARESGMRIGLYQDLAIGSSPAGADVWAFPELFARGVSVGAPPDPYAAQGQNWGLPPLDPRILRRSGYQYFIDLVRNGFRHAGALRVDHVLGFFRLFWIPEGASGEDGAYVRYPAEDLFGILALESVRNQAVVVGEDLGTVPPEVPAVLESWGVLSSKVMFFEREHDGRFRAPSSYPRLSLATADTHDMVPIAGFWAGQDITVREKVGLIDASKAEEERRNRENDREQLLDRLAEEHVLPRHVAWSESQLIGAVHAMMCRTPAMLVGLALDDLAAECDPVNVPGVGQDKYESWTRKMRDPLEVIFASDDTATALRCDGRRGVGDG